MFNAIQCQEWAKEASSLYVSNGEPIRSSIARISNNNGLNPTQIQRIIELANQITYSRLFKSTEDKTFTFPIAKLSDVLDDIKNIEAPTFQSSPCRFHREVEADALRQAFGVQEQVPDPAQHVQKVTILIEKCANAQDELKSQAIMAGVNADQYFRSLKETWKQLLIGGHPSNDLVQAIVLSFPDRKDDVIHMLTEIKKELHEDGVKIASASEFADPGLISDELKAQGVRVVNGQHPLCLTVRDFLSKQDEKTDLKSGIEYLGSKIDELKRSIR